MDTRAISADTYKAILVTAGDAHKDLALQFGLLAKISKDEQDYILKAEQLVNLMMQYSDEDIDAIFVEEPLSREDFLTALQTIYTNLKAL